MELTSPSVIRALMSEAGITFRKEFGQNFLTSRDVVARIADSAAESEDTVILEIGPGIGTLTQELCERYRKVVAIEIDRGLIPLLGKTLAPYDNVTVIEGDVMKVDLRALIEREAEGHPVAVCANLPYYITTPILMRLLEARLPLTSITVMIQSEVADRLAAAAGSAEYGAITAVLGYYGKVSRLFTVSAGCFLPPPKVSSAVVRIDLYKEPPAVPRSEALLFRVIHAAFAQRRKTLVNALSGVAPLDKATLLSLITSQGHSPTVRGECLSTRDFIALADAIDEKTKRPQ
ncbi:MAG: 16S rRNA (adenine(1518)-N(6)/adenine(1519)-N(6))-dimethyltransferase RsmA [Clostridia bacterium]|nr:16S rRNA (adenine(1518)-N(6)/adenine(1519)-N(6))-dimethyltransferase RsmA [Clostridia bacterium]